MKVTINIGDLFAIGFDQSCNFMLTVSHSGRGVYDTRTWARIARDESVANPAEGIIRGIGPIAHAAIVIQEKDYITDTLVGKSPEGKAGAAMTARLTENGLTSAGSNTIRITGNGSGASTLVGSGSIPQPGR